MKKAAKVALWIAGIYAGLMLVSGLAIKLMLSKNRIDGFLSSIESRLPVTVSAGQGEFSLADWFLWRPAITIQRLAIGNPEGFSAQPMLVARQVSAQLRLLSLFSDRFDVLRLNLREPIVTIEQNRNGVSNVEALLGALSKGKAEEGAKVGALLIDALYIDSGMIRYMQRPEAEAFTIRDIDLSLANFGPDTTCRMALQARLFEGQSSRIDFEGRAGPFSEKSLPAQGKLSVGLAPAEIPASLRQEYFGDLLREPGGESRATLEATIQGNLVQLLQGEGKLGLSGFQLGRSKENRIALQGQAPLSVTIRKLLTSPAFELRTKNASLELGHGRWKGSADAGFDGSRFRGGSNGTINGVEINELLSAFTTSKDAVFGRAEIPEYKLRFEGSNADQIRNSLNGQGEIKIEEGRIALFDLVDTIQQRVKKMLTGETPAQGATNFTRFASRLVIQDRKIQMPELVLENPSLRVTGQGSIGFDRSLNFDLVANLSGDLASQLGSRLVGSNQAELHVPVRVRGTVDSPKVYPDVGRMVKERAVEKAKSLLDKLFQKQEEPKP